MFHPLAPQRILPILATAKLIVLLRNPGCPSLLTLPSRTHVDTSNTSRNAIPGANRVIASTGSGTDLRIERSSCEDAWLGSTASTDRQKSHSRHARVGSYS